MWLICNANSEASGLIGSISDSTATMNTQESVIALISYFMLSLSLRLIKLTLFLKMLLHLMYTDSSSVVPTFSNTPHDF